jgi:hypothetical protein
MHRADLAELLLSLVTTRERAVSVSGDLLEESEGGGAGRFWLLVARTTVRQAWRQMAAAPFGMAGAAVRGWFAGVGADVAAFAIIGLPVLIVMGLLKLGFHIDLSGWAIPFLGTVIGLVVPFQVGRWMARRYPGREVAGCFSLVALQFAIWFCANFIQWEFGRSGGLAPGGNLFHALASAVSDVFLMLVPLLAGAAFARARMLKSV